MSHVTQVRTRIEDREVLLRILQELGFTCKENRSVRFEGRVYRMEITAGSGRGVSVGFTRASPAAPFRAHFFGTAGTRREELRAALHQRYARAKILQEARRRSYVLVRETSLNDNRIRLVLRKVA